MVVYYDGKEDVLRCIFRWHATLTKEVVCRYEIWLILGIGITMTVLFDQEVLHLPDGVMEMEITPFMGPVLSVATFSAVFYNSQCFARYMALYNGCMQVDTAIKVFVAELLSDFGHDIRLRAHILAATKYIIAASFFFYSSMDDREMNADHWNWFGPKAKGLLTEREIDFVKGFPGHKVLLLAHWSQRVVAAAVAHEACGSKFSPPEKAAITNRLFRQIDNVGEQSRSVSNTLNLPIPFPYFHLLNLLIFFSLFVAGLCCCIFAAQVKGNSYCVAIGPLSVIAFVLIGMRTLASDLSDPFGTDDVDFPQCDFMRHIYDHAVALLNAPMRLCPVANNLIAETEEFTVEQLMAPCVYSQSEMPEGADVKTKELAFSGPRRSGLDLVRVGDNLMHGPRVWIHPEDWYSANRVAQWMTDEPKAKKLSDFGMDSSEKETKAVKLASPAPAPAATPANPAPPQDLADCLRKMDERLARVVRVAERIPEGIGQALGIKLDLPPAPQKKSEKVDLGIGTSSRRPKEKSMTSSLAATHDDSNLVQPTGTEKGDKKTKRDKKEKKP